MGSPHSTYNDFIWHTSVHFKITTTWRTTNNATLNSVSTTEKNIYIFRVQQNERLGLCEVRRGRGRGSRNKEKKTTQKPTKPMQKAKRIHILRHGRVYDSNDYLGEENWSLRPKPDNRNPPPKKKAQKNIITPSFVCPKHETRRNFRRLTMISMTMNTLLN